MFRNSMYDQGSIPDKALWFQPTWGVTVLDNRGNVIAKFVTCVPNDAHAIKIGRDAYRGIYWKIWCTNIRDCPESFGCPYYMC